MSEYFKDRSAGSISADEAQQWIKSLVGKTSAATVRRNWIPASKTVFEWAVEQKHNSLEIPFKNVKITVPKKNHGFAKPKLSIPSSIGPS